MAGGSPVVGAVLDAVVVVVALAVVARRSFGGDVADAVVAVVVVVRGSFGFGGV